VREPSLLLLIPAYNEEKRIEPVLRDYGDFFSKNYSGKFKLLVVLNGCRDNTLGVVKKVQKEYPCIDYLNIPEPVGKGGALIEGLKLAPECDLVGYVDADGATKAEAFYDLVKRCDEADCVIGSRWIEGAVLHQAQNRRRQFASRVFHTIVELLFRMRIKDTQCGAKVMKKEAVQKIYSYLTVADMAFDINLLYVLKREGFKILEVPTVWTDVVGSKVRLFRTSFVMLLSVIRLRLIYSPFYKWMAPLRPLEIWIYTKLRAPVPKEHNPEKNKLNQ